MEIDRPRTQRRGDFRQGFIENGAIFPVVAFREKAILLVVYVGIIALSRGITEIFLAFKLKGLRRRLAAA